MPPPSEAKVRALAKALGEEPLGLSALAGIQKHRRAFLLVEKAALSKDFPSSHDLLKQYEMYRDVAAGSAVPLPPASGVEQALGVIWDELLRGLQHGSFDLRIEGKALKKGRRELKIHAGRIHRFVIEPEELEAERL